MSIRTAGVIMIVLILGIIVALALNEPSLMKMSMAFAGGVAIGDATGR